MLPSVTWCRLLPALAKASRTLVTSSPQITTAYHPQRHYQPHRLISLFPTTYQQDKPSEENGAAPEAPEDNEEVSSSSSTPPQKKVILARHMDRDRSKKIPVETSVRYLKSEAYREAYGDNPVWLQYRRNFPGQWAPKKTRKTCIVI